MTATELESVLRTEIGRLNTALSELRGEFKERVANLQTEDKVLQKWAQSADLKIQEAETLARECEQRITAAVSAITLLLEQKTSAITTDLALLRRDFDHDKKDREKWGGRAWQFAAVAFGSILTALIAVLLTMAGIKKL